MSLLTMLLNFVSRTVFIKILGEEYLGLNGLLTNVLSMLSLAELGIGTAMVYMLYKPLAEQNNAQLRALMVLYKRFYVTIGLVVAGAGLALLPFLPYLIGGKTELQHITLYYVLFLVNSVISYFFVYNQSLYNADQKNYIVSVVRFIFRVIITIVQTIVLLATHSFTAYLIVAILTTLVTNLTLTYMVKKSYAHVFTAPKIKLSKDVMTQLKHNVYGNVSSKFGDVIVFGTDNILISMFVGLSSVGLYANYTLILNSVQGIINSIMSSMTATIGNVAVTADDKQSLQLFRRYLFFNHTIEFFAMTFFFALINPFITVWIGGQYLMNYWVVILIAVGAYATGMRSSGNIFIAAYGLIWHQRMKPVYESILNLGISILFLAVFKLGVVGILLSTLLTNLLFTQVYEIVVVFRHAFHTPVRAFYKQYAVMLLSFALSITLELFVMSLAPAMNAWANLLYNAVVGIGVASLVYFGVNFKSGELAYLIGIVNQLRLKILKR
jgi:O-antigen/teichoic acid export membrane protein